MRTRIGDILSYLYGKPSGSRAAAKLERLLARRSRRLRPSRSAPGPGSPSLSEKDAILIAYADHLSEAGVPALRSLKSFLVKELDSCFSGVHILPFFPSSSDDGFSVVDYHRVDPRLGDWSEVRSIAADFRLMVDLVLNHVSAQSAWFRGFLRGDKRLARYFITVSDETDLSSVFRPRSDPLVTEFQTRRGKRLVWTTFSADQVDLNYGNPEVLLAMVDVLLFYVEQGAQIIRLDAVAFLWKELGTPCVHLPQTHAVVRLLRAIIEEICPWVVLVTETNVPHDLNVSYLGNGTDEANLIYNFSLPPLMADAFRREDAGVLSDWADSVKIPPRGSFLNFLSSHDGIGLLPARGYLSDTRIADLVELVRARGGFVSLRSEVRGSRTVETPYELNIPWLDALSDSKEDEETRLLKLATSHCAMLCLAGVPAVYINALLGTPADREEALRSGRPRATNRRKLALGDLRASLAEGQSFSARALRALAQCLSARRSHAAFHPAGAQEILRLNGHLFTVLRTSPDGQRKVLCVHNLSARPQTLAFDAGIIGARPGGSVSDILSGEALPPPQQAGRDSPLSVSVQGYGTAWISLASGGPPAS
jgi:glucosylglycerate phosphorylase